jgi:hypothetical protein
MDRTLLSSDTIDNNGDNSSIGRVHSNRFLSKLWTALAITSILYVIQPLMALIWTWICDLMGQSQPSWIFEHRAWLASQFGYLIIFTVTITAFVINRYTNTVNLTNCKKLVYFMFDP